MVGWLTRPAINRHINRPVVSCSIVGLSWPWPLTRSQNGLPVQATFVVWRPDIKFELELHLGPVKSSRERPHNNGRKSCAQLTRASWSNDKHLAALERGRRGTWGADGNRCTLLICVVKYIAAARRRCWGCGGRPRLPSVRGPCCPVSCDVELM